MKTIPVETQTLDLKMPNGTCDAYFSHPKGEGKYPAVLLLMDAFGLRPYLQEMTETLASAGYIVLAPNFFYRIKRSPVVERPFPLKKEDMPEATKEIRTLIGNFNMAQGVEDAEAYLNFLSEQKQFNGNLGATGYCMGGQYALRIAARYPDRVQAVASFHAGNLATTAENSPHLLLPKIKAPVYVAHADNDGSMPQEQIEHFENALKESHPKDTAEVYRGSIHGFTMKDLPAYGPEHLERHWKNLERFFTNNLNH
jgi:carboxymethylenebutenolidase